MQFRSRGLSPLSWIIALTDLGPGPCFESSHHVPGLQVVAISGLRALGVDCDGTGLRKVRPY